MNGSRDIARRPACLGLAVAVGIFMASAGLLKLYDLPAFAETLRTWSVLPDWARAGSLVSVPIVEVVLGMSLVIGLFQRAVLARCMIALLVTFTMAYVIATVLQGTAPTCGCLGGSSGPESFLPSAIEVIIRNVMLSAGLFPLARSRSVTNSQSRASRLTGRWPGVRSSPAFSLVETITAIAVIAVLLALAVPSFVASRNRAMVTRQITSARTHAQVMAMYNADYQGAFPIVVPLAPGPWPVTWQSRGLTVHARLFETDRVWDFALADLYYHGDVATDAFAGRGHRGSPGGNAMVYSTVFMARPEFWDPQTITTVDEQIGANFDRDVVYPSMKHLIIENYFFAHASLGLTHNSPVAVGFVDGHAREVDPRRVTRRGRGEGISEYRLVGTLVLNNLPYTHRGAAGRDTP